MKRAVAFNDCLCAAFTTVCVCVFWHSALLRDNILLNDADNQVEVVEAAAGLPNKDNEVESHCPVPRPSIKLNQPVHSDQPCAKQDRGNIALAKPSATTHASDCNCTSNPTPHAALTFYPRMPGNSTMYPEEKWKLQGGLTSTVYFENAVTFRCPVMSLSQIFDLRGISRIDLLKIVSSVQNPNLQHISYSTCLRMHWTFGLLHSCYVNGSRGGWPAWHSSSCGCFCWKKFVGWIQWWAIHGCSHVQKPSLSSWLWANPNWILTKYGCNFFFFFFFLDTAIKILFISSSPWLLSCKFLSSCHRFTPSFV